MTDIFFVNCSRCGEPLATHSDAACIENLKKRLEQLEKERNVWRQKQHDDDVKTLQVLDVLRKRLEKCEAVLRANLERHGQCLCSSCDAARAALEGK